jgi:hypothetical protein
MIHEKTRSAASGYLALIVLPLLALLFGWQLIRIPGAGTGRATGRTDV